MSMVYQQQLKKIYSNLRWRSEEDTKLEVLNVDDQIVNRSSGIFQ
jgi:hypothetical protein